MTFNNQKYLEICSFLNDFAINNKTKHTIIAVTKNCQFKDINDALNKGIRHFGEIRTQEAIKKYIKLKDQFIDMKLHMIGPLQTNKVKNSLTIFDFFHSLDRENLANEFSKYPEQVSSKSFFIQVNTGQEKQKSGIQLNQTSEFIRYCNNDLSLNIIGLMCLPPINDDPKKHFSLLNKLALDNNLKQLSMGMSRDYKSAIECGATFIRIGSSFFGE